MEHENNIPEGWVETTLGEIANITMGQSPKSEFYNTEGNGMPFYQGVTEFNDKYVGVKNFTTKTTKVVPKNSILFSVRAPVGKVNFTKSECCIGRGNAGMFMENGNQNFLYYQLKFSERKLQDYSSGTVFTSISGKELNIIPVLVPKKQEEQKAIAKVLTAFDDKIELLQAQNKTLETMAQTIFKEWFGKYKIGDDLPEGWSFSPLYSIARYINGAAFKSQDFSKDKTGLPIVKIVELKNGITDSTAFSKKVVDSKYYIDDGDILFSWSGSPETSIDVFLWSSGKAILNQHSFNVKVDDDNEKAWVYFLLKYKKSLFIHLAKMKQTTGLGHVTISDLKENHFATPPKDDRKRFGKVFNGFLQKIMTNQSQIQSLRKTRDTLLPKLMSGQVRVKNLKQTADA